jgi:serine/threonine-protein kinase
MLTAGTKLGRYEIRSQLGAGGMGEVYLAEDTKLGRKVALKTLPEEFTNDKERLRRFQMEARAASALNHPNLLTIHEIGAESGAHFIAAEYVDGETLRTRLKPGRMKIDDALDVAQQTAFALTAAHGAGILHRDIKPENIMVRHDGIVKVLDFGLAKLLEDRAREMIDHEADTRALVLTDPGRVLGTPAYMSPEQARGQDLDARTDIWSLGVVLYEMVAGRAPFRGETKSHTVVSILETEPAPLATLAPDAPAELQRIVRKALTKDRDSRYQTARDLMNDLKSLRRDLDIQSEMRRSSAPDISDPDSAVNQKFPAKDSEGAASEQATSLAEPRPTRSDRQHPEGSIRYRIGALLAMLILAVGALGTWYYFQRQTARVTADSINSIAVMPFVNASNDPNTEYFSDGITETIINSLSQLPHKKILARTTVFRYKGRDADPQKVGNELGVDALLTGRVTQQGDTLTIQAELVRVSDGSELWGGRYNKKLADIFVVQNEIANEISETLRLKLNSDEQKRVTNHSTDNVEAYQLYLKGKFEANKFTPEGLGKGIEYFNQAIAIDPTYALAYAGLSDLYIAQAHVFVPPKEGYAKAKWASEKAAQLDDTLAEAHEALGSVKLYSDWDFPAAEREFKRAIELNPNYSLAHSNLSCKFKALRRYPEEIAEARRGQELDPLSAFANMELGEAFYHARRYDEAIVQIKKTLELDPQFFVTYHVGARTYEQKKMYAEAIAACQEWLKNFPDDPNALASLAHVYATMGKRREAEDIIRKLLEISKQRYFSPYWIAVVYAGLGDNDQAFQYFEKAFEDRYFLMIWINSDPRFDNIRSDPRFADLVRRVGLLQ